MVGLAVGAFITNFFGAIGSDLGHAVDHSLQSTFPISYVGIVIMSAGLGLILYKAFDEKFHRKVVKDQEELDQIDRQDNQRNEGDDRYTPANI